MFVVIAKHLSETWVQKQTIGDDNGPLIGVKLECLIGLEPQGWDEFRVG